MTDILIEERVRISGEYRLVLNAGTPRERDTGWFKNMVLDNGLNMLGSGPSSIFANCSVGTGTAAPAAGQTTLGTYLAQKLGTSSTAATNVGTPTYAGQFTSSYTFAQGAVIGNIAEVGIGPGTLGTNLFSRSRIVDGSGTPTTLTVVALDQLTVYYRVTVTPVVTDATGSFLISGVSYNYTTRLGMAGTFMSAVGSYTSSDRFGAVIIGAGNLTAAYPAASTLGAITATPSGSPSQASSYSLAAYSTGTFYNDTSIVWSIGQGNTLGGIGTVFVNWGCPSAGLVVRGGSQISFSPAIPKDNTKVLTLVFRVAWSR